VTARYDLEKIMPHCTEAHTGEQPYTKPA
jgi:hypothetical protein